MTADLVQDAALDTDTVARVTTKLYSAARPLRAAQHLMIDPPTPLGYRNLNPLPRGEPPELNP